jgi:hypothetical protein
MFIHFTLEFQNFLWFSSSGFNSTGIRSKRFLRLSAAPMAGEEGEENKQHNHMQQRQNIFNYRALNSVINALRNAAPYRLLAYR